MHAPRDEDGRIGLTEGVSSFVWKEDAGSMRVRMARWWDRTGPSTKSSARVMYILSITHKELGGHVCSDGICNIIDVLRIGMSLNEKRDVMAGPGGSIRK